MGGRRWGKGGGGQGAAGASRVPSEGRAGCPFPVVHRMRAFNELNPGARGGRRASWIKARGLAEGWDGKQRAGVLFVQDCDVRGCGGGALAKNKLDPYAQAFDGTLMNSEMARKG